MRQPVVLVTGASRGIGKACALLFAENGYHVFLNARTSIPALEDLAQWIQAHTPGSSEVVPGDVGNPEDVRRIFTSIRNSRGGLDVLVNNAGIAHLGLLTDMSDAEWNKVIQTNLSSVFYCCREAIPYMVSRREGHIINISSMWGRSGASCEAAYSASKAGVHGLTQALSKELAPSGISVNAVACGVIDTSMNDLLPPEEKAALAEEIPAGRFGTPEEAAQCVFAIASSSSYLTGQIIGLDGGYL